MYDVDKLCKILKASEAINFILPIRKGVALFKIGEFQEER